MPTNFDIEIDRRHTGSVKWEFVTRPARPVPKKQNRGLFR